MTTKHPETEALRRFHAFVSAEDEAALATDDKALTRAVSRADALTLNLMAAPITSASDLAVMVRAAASLNFSEGPRLERLMQRIAEFSRRKVGSMAARRPAAPRRAPWKPFEGFSLLP